MNGLAVLQRLGRGELIEELAAALAATAEEVVNTGKPGTVTLTLKVSTKSIGDAFIAIEEQIARSSPKRDPKGAYLFAIGGELHRDDPRQTRMPLRALGLDDADAREVDGGIAVREVTP